MKKSFKIKKSVVESMVDDAIRSMLKESTESTSYEDSMEKERRFTYDDLSQEVMHWALNYADSGHNQPINAIQYMHAWYLGDDNALDMVCDKFADWKGIECDNNVMKAVEKAALEIGYYENWNEDRIEFDESKEKKEAQSVEDMKRKVKSLNQKVNNADEELPELRNQISTLKNKLSSMKEGLDYEDSFNEWLMDSYGMDLEDFYSLPEDEQQNYYEEYDNSVSMAADDMRDWQRDSMMMESFKSQKLKDFARQHGGLTDGQWSYGFENDLYNMSDEDFDAYEVVDRDEHYAKYGLNGTDKTGYSNNNFQPLNFGDGTFMVKKNPKFGWDERAEKLMKRRSDRRKNRKGVSEAKLNCIVSKTIKKVLNEGIYDYPDGIDNIIFLSENDRELYEEYMQIAKACMKLYKKDVQLSLERLAESSIMKRYQQHCFKKYAKEQQGLDRMNSPREFRRFIAEKIIDEVVNEAWDDNEMMNESDIWNLGGYRSKHQMNEVKKTNENYRILSSSEDNKNTLNEGYGYQNVDDEFVEKVGENGYEVWVPDWALCYLVNGDTECMDDEDIAKVDKFVETYQDKVEPYVGDCCMPMDGEEPSFRYENSIDKLGADCYRFFLPAK